MAEQTIGLPIFWETYESAAHSDESSILTQYFQKFACLNHIAFATFVRLQKVVRKELICNLSRFRQTLVPEIRINMHALFACYLIIHRKLG